MTETATSPTPTETTATPATEPVSAPVGTAQPNGSEAKAGQSAPSEETFYSGDPNTLPPEIREQYNNMLKDYKQKTQSIAEARKKADNYDKISKDSRFVEYWNGLNRQQKADFKEQKAEVEKKLGEKITDDRFQKSFESKDGFLEMVAEVAREATSKNSKEIEELRQFKTVSEASNIVEAFATELGADNKPVRPDFYDLDTDGLISGFLQINAKPGLNPQEYREQLDQAYNWSKQMTQKYYEKGRQDALARIQQKAATSSNPPTNAAKGAYSGPDPKKLSVREAMDLARKGQRVPQNHD
jgi:predicted house-cleaning noncanonical NTP pyrophosphatase (MazG superfamily)